MNPTDTIPAFTPAQRARGIRRLLGLADTLDTADAEHRRKHEPTYDQTRLVHFMPTPDKDAVHACGTPACSFGHYIASTHRSDLRRHRTNIRRHGYLDMPIYSFAADEFSITNEQAVELFGATGCGRAKTAKQAARYIRALVKRLQKINTQAQPVSA